MIRFLPLRGEALVNVFGVPFFSPDASARRKINTRSAINTKIPGKNVEKIPQKCVFSDPKNAF